MTEQEIEELFTDIGAIDGTVMSLYELGQFILDHADALRALYDLDREILFVGFGMNDGDDEFTVNTEIHL